MRNAVYIGWVKVETMGEFVIELSQVLTISINPISHKSHISISFIWNCLYFIPLYFSKFSL